MKFKKILAAIAASTVAVTAFSGVVMAAGSYGAPSFTTNVEYPVDLDGDNYLVVTVGYTGFEGFSAYNKLKKTGVGITSAGVTLGYDSSALDYVTTLDGEFADGTAGSTKPSMQYAWADANMKNVPSTDNFMQAYFTVKDGVDFSSKKIEFTFDAYEIGVTNCVSGTSTVECYGNSAASVADITADAFYYGSEAPAVTTYTVTATSDVEVTGADISAPVAEGTKINVAAKAKDGYTAKLLANGVEIAAGEYTVTGNVDFTVDYTAIVPANPHKYTLDDKGTCMKDTVKGIYYSLSVKNVADKLAIKVSDKIFEATGIPEVTGDTVSTLTYVILGVPDEIYNAVPVLGGVTSGETVFDAE